MKDGLRLYLIAVIIAMLLLASCHPTPVSTGTAEAGEYVHIPIGRLVDSGNTVQILLDDVERDFSVVRDEHSGSWYRVPMDQLGEDSIISLVLTKTEGRDVYENRETNTDLWLKPSEYVDNDDPTIIEKAEELTAGLETRGEKVQAILDFVYLDVEFKLVRGTEKDFKSASEALADGYGICMNKARIFVALCRASGIPARVIAGSVVSLDDGYDYHHDWVEYYDGSAQRWIPLDPTSGNEIDFENRMLIGLIYNVDDNSLFPFRSWADDYVEIDEGISVLFPERDLHWRTGRLGYRVIENNLPDHLLLRIDYGPFSFPES